MCRVCRGPGGTCRPWCSSGLSLQPTAPSAASPPEGNSPGPLLPWPLPRGCRRALHAVSRHPVATCSRLHASAVPFRAEAPPRAPGSWRTRPSHTVGRGGHTAGIRGESQPWVFAVDGWRPSGGGRRCLTLPHGASSDDSDETNRASGASREGVSQRPSPPRGVSEAPVPAARSRDVGSDAVVSFANASSGGRTGLLLRGAPQTSGGEPRSPSWLLLGTVTGACPRRVCFAATEPRWD